METCPPQKVIRKTFIAKEYKLSHTFLLPDGKEQAIKGTLDSLIFDFKRHRLCVVEYKTYHPVDPTAQLVQAALYSYVLHKNLSVPVDVKVFCVLPQFKEYDYSWQELEKSIYRLIPHKLGQIQQWLSWQPGEASAPPPTSGPDLCSRCPQEKRCREFFP
jgi:S-DNA-T family DNA segregation ATPase FtsK/SpoIIIE